MRNDVLAGQNGVRRWSQLLPCFALVVLKCDFLACPRHPSALMIRRMCQTEENQMEFCGRYWIYAVLGRSASATKNIIHTFDNIFKQTRYYSDSTNKWFVWIYRQVVIWVVFGTRCEADSRVQKLRLVMLPKVTLVYYDCIQISMFLVSQLLEKLELDSDDWSVHCSSQLKSLLIDMTPTRHATF